MTKQIRLGYAYCRMMESLKKYSTFDKIPIRRAKYVLSRIHRMHKPYSTRIIGELSNAGWIKLNGGFGDIELIR